MISGSFHILRAKSQQTPQLMGSSVSGTLSVYARLAPFLVAWKLRRFSLGERRLSDGDPPLHVPMYAVSMDVQVCNKCIRPL